MTDLERKLIEELRLARAALAHAADKEDFDCQRCVEASIAGELGHVRHQAVGPYMRLDAFLAGLGAEL